MTKKILIIVLSRRQCSLKTHLICKSLTCSLSKLHFQDYIFFIPLPDDKILDSSKLKEFADDDFKFDENCRKLSKWVENTVGKGEIARYAIFKRLVSQGHQKVSLCGNGLNDCLTYRNLVLTKKNILFGSLLPFDLGHPLRLPYGRLWVWCAPIVSYTLINPLKLCRFPGW